MKKTKQTNLGHVWDTHKQRIKIMVMRQKKCTSAEAMDVLQTIENSPQFKELAQRAIEEAHNRGKAPQKRRTRWSGIANRLVLSNDDRTLEDRRIADMLGLPPMYSGADSRDSRIMNRLVVARIVAHRARLARGEAFIKRYTSEFSPTIGLG